jgi:hypothetical protein
VNGLVDLYVSFQNNLADPLRFQFSSVFLRHSCSRNMRPSVATKQRLLLKGQLQNWYELSPRCSVLLSMGLGRLVSRADNPLDLLAARHDGNGHSFFHNREHPGISLLA